MYAMTEIHIRRRLYALVIALVMVLAMSGCSDSDNEASEEKTAPVLNEDIGRKDSMSSTSGDGGWAVYWYLCGGDLESGGGFASGDLEELMSVQLPENVTVVIEAGGSESWENDFDPDMLTRCVYDADGFEVVEEIPSASMGDPDTLADFLTFCNENYPADRRAVVFWNHGGGNVAGIAFDELYDDDSLTLPELGAAFEAADFGGKYELIGFDACLMATIDTAATFVEYANWMVASEETEPGCGWDYEGFFEALSSNTGMNGGELGKEICDTYYAGCEDIGQADETTLSVIELSKVPELVQVYDAAGCEALLQMIYDTGYINHFGRAARGAENYGGNNKSEGYTNMVDLGDLVHKTSKDSLIPMSGEKILAALEQAVFYQVKGSLRSKATGLSCYYNYNGDYENLTGFADLAASPAFAYFYDYTLTGRPTAEMYDYASANVPSFSSEPVELQAVERPDADSLEDHPVTITDDGIAVMDLGGEIANQLVGVYFDLAYIDEESDMIVFLGLDNDLDADWETGVFKDNFRGVWGSIGGELVYMELSDEADEYQTYAVPILLNGEEYTLSVSYIFATEEYKILGARKGVDENGMSDKNIRPLLTGDVVEPLLYVMFDMESDEDAKPTAVGRVEVTANTVFEEIDLGDGSFVFMFEMVDVQNNSYLSEAVLIEVVDGEIFLS